MGFTHFVSWCWDYRVLDVISSLKVWSDQQTEDLEGHRLSQRDLNWSPIFLWMCFFCNNQRRVLLGIGPSANEDNLQHAFDKRLEAVAESGHVLAIFDQYENPRYTQ